MIALIIPALNEGQVIGRVVRSIPTVVDRIIVVDNGSTDDTSEQAKKAGAQVLPQPIRGYGRACRTGAEAAIDAGAEIIAFMDGDGSDCPEFLAAIIQPILRDEYDFVIGSRMRGQREPDSLTIQQIVAARLAGWVLSFWSDVRYTDMSPFRAIRRSVLETLPMREQTYGWNLEMQMLVAQIKTRVLEIPVNYRRRQGGVSKVSGTFRGTLIAGARIGLTFLRVAFLAKLVRKTSSALFRE